MLPAFVVAGVIAALLPRGDGDTPPAGPLLLAALLVAAVTTGALYLALRRDLGLPATVALTAVAYNAIVVLLKLVIGPLGLYDENQRRDLDSMFAPDEAAGALLAAGLVLALYLGAFAALYRVVGGRLRRREVRPRTGRTIVLVVVLGVLLLATGGGAILLIPLLVAGAGLSYLDFVFASAWSLVVATAAASATMFAALALRGARDQAEAVGNAAVLVTFFWIGVAFLALYHVLWVVYILVLTSIWPLKTVTPK